MLGYFSNKINMTLFFITEKNLIEILKRVWLSFSGLVINLLYYMIRCIIKNIIVIKIISYIQLGVSRI